MATHLRAQRSHPNKPKKWLVRRNFNRFNRFRNDRWVFGVRDHAINDRGDVAYLTIFTWTRIVRHQLVTGTSSPDDPYLAGYRAARRRKVRPRSEADVELSRGLGLTAVVDAHFYYVRAGDGTPRPIDDYILWRNVALGDPVQSELFSTLEGQVSGRGVAAMSRACCPMSSVIARPRQQLVTNW